MTLIEARTKYDLNLVDLKNYPFRKLLNMNDIRTVSRQSRYISGLFLIDVVLINMNERKYYISKLFDQ